MQVEVFEHYFYCFNQIYCFCQNIKSDENVPAVCFHFLSRLEHVYVQRLRVQFWILLVAYIKQNSPLRL